MIRRLLQMLAGGQSETYRNKWERMTGEPCPPPAREKHGRAWPTSPPPPKREGQQ